jgi:Tetratricopeptide repeat/Bacterial SH3 domain
MSGTRLFLILIMATATLPAGRQQGFFEEGNQQYSAGDYAGAVESYKKIIDAGMASGEVYYNLGNAYFRLGDLGRATLFYERALRERPGDPDTLANLELVRSVAVDDIAPLPRFWVLRVVEWWVHLIPRAVLIAIVATAYGMAGAAVITLLLTRSAPLHRWTRHILATSVVVLVLSATNLLVRELRIGESVQGVVLAAEADAQSAPSDDRSLQVFTIHAGTTVRVEQESGEWAEIVLQDGQVGWIKRDAIEII